MSMLAEGSHEKGRQGCLQAKDLLSRVLGSAVDLPFNVYDHTQRLTFEDFSGTASASFSFDLGGILRRRAPEKFGGEYVVEVFVEVKNTSNAKDLLSDYRDFLRRAAIVTATGKHPSSWFVFISSCAFGASKGVELVDGSLLKTCAKDWPETIRGAADDLNGRLVLLIATASFVRMLGAWGTDAR